MYLCRMPKIIGFLLFFILIINGCGKYQKLLKSSDFEKKYEMAVKYFEKGDENKALPLFEELISIYRGTEKGEKILYYFAYCNYNLGDYILAAYHFKNFAKSFPSSVHAEECLYMNAYCHYLSSPVYSLDQTSTLEAIQEFQHFANAFPQSARVSEANELIDKLRFKLERKAYEIAKLYFRTMNYKAASIAFQNSIKEFPDSPFVEEMYFLIVKSNFLLAENSVEEKKKERYVETMTAYTNFIDKFPSSKYLNEAEGIYESSLKQKNKTT